MKLRIVFIFFFLLSTTLLGECLAQNTQINWYSVNAGYGEPETENTVIRSIAGQNFVGFSHLSDHQIISGFFADTLFRWTVVGVQNQGELPKSYLLAQNYPNPFNPSTTIHFELPEKLQVSVKVFNALGQEIMTLLNETLATGKYDLSVDGSGLSSGVYFYQLRTDRYTNTKKFILLR